MIKLHLGCGDIYFKDWVNIDIDSKIADKKLDLRKRLPYKTNSVDYIFNEHLLEHLTLDEGCRFLSECHRILKPNGVLRISTPDMDNILFRHFFFWKQQSWLKKYGYEWVKTKAELTNINFREWGHQYLYNEEELKRRLVDAGFSKMSRQKLKKSNHDELKNLETRTEGFVMEAIK